MQLNDEFESLHRKKNTIKLSNVVTSNADINTNNKNNFNKQSQIIAVL